MALQPRIEFPGAFYHVMSRGDRREPIFETTTTGACFYAPPTECCEKGGWRIYAWVLRSNHYHWVLQTPLLASGVEPAGVGVLEPFHAGHQIGLRGLEKR